MKFNKLGIMGVFTCWVIMSAMGCVSIMVETEETVNGDESSTGPFYSNDPCFVFDEATQLTLDICLNNFTVNHDVTFAYHDKVPVGNVDRMTSIMLDKATEAAVTKHPTEDDVRCDIALNCSPQTCVVDENGITECKCAPLIYHDVDLALGLNAEGLDYIDSVQKFNLVRNNVSRWVKVVNYIDVCWNDDGVLEKVALFVAGCADGFPAESIFMIHQDASIAGGVPEPPDEYLAALFLHEVGHNKGSYHTLPSHRVMYLAPDASTTTLTALECGRLHIETF